MIYEQWRFLGIPVSSMHAVPRNTLIILEKSRKGSLKSLHVVDEGDVVVTTKKKEDPAPVVKEYSSPESLSGFKISSGTIFKRVYTYQKAGV